MSEFEGTNGKWFIGTGDPNGVEIFAHRIQVDNTDEWDICAVWDDLPNSEANAVLICKAPEMLEMLKQSLETIKWYMENSIPDDNHDDFFNIGMSQRAEIEQLIQDATTI